MEPKPRKTKMMFGLKVKKKKKQKANKDLVLVNPAAQEEDLESSEPLGVQDSETLEGQAVAAAASTRAMDLRKRSKLNTCIQDMEGKPQSFQIAVNITEARQLVGENIDPSVVIEIGDEKKQTAVKEGTNAPFFDEYFVFEFFAHRELFLDKVIKLTVIHSKMLRSFCIGSCAVDVWTVYGQPDHQFINKWAALTNPSDISTGVKGYIKCDITVSAKGDTVQPEPKTSDSKEQIDKHLLIPDGFPSERPWARFSVKVYRAEELPKNNTGLMANVTKAFIKDSSALIDPYVVVSFFNRVGRTSTQKSTAEPVWNEQIIFTEMFPPLCQRLKIQVWDEGSMSDVAIATHYIDLRRVSNEQDGDKGFLPTFGPAWINLYGSTRNSWGCDDHSGELNEGVGEGVSYRGRIYLELAVEILTGGSGSEARHRAKAAKDAKAGKPGAKDGKSPAGGGSGPAGGAADDDKGKVAEVLPVEPPPEVKEDYKRSFLLFGALFEATMIDRKIGDKPITFEFSQGNYGNVLESATPSASPAICRRRNALDVTDSGDMSPSSPSSPSSPLLPRDPSPSRFVAHSATPPVKPRIVEGNRFYMYMPVDQKKPCISVVSQWENRTYRLYNSNMLDNMASMFEEGVAKATELHRMSHPSSEPTLRATVREFCVNGRAPQRCFWILQIVGRLSEFGEFHHLLQELSSDESCFQRYFRLSWAQFDDLLTCIDAGISYLDTNHRSFMEAADAKLKAELKSSFLTHLDRKRLTMCKRELESLMAKALSITRRTRKAGVLKAMLKDICEVTQQLHFLVQEPQHTVPDTFVWLLSNNKRVAYARIRTRDLLYSESWETRGVHCGKLITLFLKSPVKRPAVLSVQAKVDVFLWFGTCSDADHMLDGLPEGLTPTTGGADANNPPTQLESTDKHLFQLRCHMYQARGLIAADTSGLSDPFARVTFMNHSQTTIIIPQTLSPTWNQCLVMQGLMLSGDLNHIQQEPPRVLVEVYDDDALGKAEYLGSTVTEPQVRLRSQPYAPPTLSYSELHCCGHPGGELLAAFELLQVPESGDQGLPSLQEEEGGVFSIPANIRPVLSTYRLEVLFWGLRELKKVQLLSVDRPQVFIECAGKTLRSSVIQKYKTSPNFSTLLDEIELELPENEHLLPPLSITVVDWRAFGRSTLVGSHVINNLKDFKYIPPPTPPPAPAPPPALSPPPSRIAKEAPVAHSSVSPAPISEGTQPTNREVLIVVEPEVPPLLTTPDPKQDQKKKKDPKTKSTRGRSTKRRGPTIADESAEAVIDWWSKYYASVEKQARQQSEAPPIQVFDNVSEVHTLLSDGLGSLVSSQSDADKKRKQKGKETLASNLGVPSKLATLQLYNKELEAELGPFDDWVQTYELFRGKASEEDGAHERFVGKFKGRFCLYKVCEDEEDEEEADTYRVNRGIPPNTSVDVLIRVYIVSASNLHPADPDGGADPYIVIRLGKNHIKDRDNYIPRNLNPVFGRSFEMKATFPQESLLSVLVYDMDVVGGDDLIGETRIDLENRFYSRYRATCGLPSEYSLEGYNAWRDSLKPSELLSKLCRENALEAPRFSPGRIIVADKVFTGKTLFVSEDEEPVESYEHLSLKILHRWAEIPGVGCKLVPEHIETRSLFKKSRPGMEQGQLQMWVEMFPMELPHPGPSVNISPRKPKGYELRVVVWNTKDVILTDTSFLTGQQSSDIYVKGWLKGLEDNRQETDVHYNSLTGEGNFNWRLVFPFNYMPAEKVMVVKKKENIFALDKTEHKIPAILLLQVWDFETLSADDFLGSLELDLHGFPPGAKTAKSCKAEMLTETLQRVSIFQQKRARGWWPFIKSGELTGKVEAEFHLVSVEEAEKNPVGRARKEPEPLPKPNRPDTSFSWFINPINVFFHLIWRRYKKYIIIAVVLLITALFLALLFYTLPGALSQKIVSG